MQTQQRYTVDEPVVWTRIESEVPTKRLVVFERYLSGSNQAVVQFGHSPECSATIRMGMQRQSG